MKEKSSVKIAMNWFGAHILAVLVGLILSFSFVGLVDYPVAYLIVGIFTVFVYIILTSGGAWKLGQDDLNKVKFNRRKKDIYRGFKIGLVECVPLFILSLLLVLSKVNIMPNFYVIYKILNGHIIIFLNFIDGTFKGIETANIQNVSWGAIIVIVFLSFIPAVVSGVNYILGYNDIVLMEKLIYKK